MNETICACLWMASGWIAGFCTAPRDALREAPLSFILAVLVIGAYAGPLVGVPAGWRLARGVVASRGH